MLRLYRWQRWLTLPVPEIFFAAGFLYGLTCGYSLEKCGKIGSILSGEVIQVIGTELPDSKWEKIKEDIIMKKH